MDLPIASQVLYLEVIFLFYKAILMTVIETIPKWSQILNSRHLPFFTHDRASFFKTHVLPLGYPYFAWSDRVYKVEGTEFSDTGYTVYQII